MKTKILFLTVFFLFSLLSFSQSVPSKAPLEQDFINYIQQIPINNYYSGVMPLPLKPHFNNKSNINHKYISNVLPTIYDMRTNGLLTNVKNQGNCNVCWAFAAMGSLESRCKVLGWGDKDFSENNLKDCHHFEIGACDPGQIYMTTSYLSRKSGPILESFDPYQAAPENCKNYLRENLYVTDVRFLPEINNWSIDSMKNALLTYGAIYTTMTWEDNSYNQNDYTYFYNGTNVINHAVLLVGWDDTKVTAGGTGAWIIKNSWGLNDWRNNYLNDNGYFYISYSDTKYLTEISAFFEKIIPYNKDASVYYYDDLGVTTGWGFGNNTGYGLVKYFAGANQQISKISTWIISDNTTVDIEIFDNFNNNVLSNYLGGISNIHCHYPGYYTFDLPAPINISSGNDFYIKVKYNTPGYNYPLPVEDSVYNYANPNFEWGRCWMSSDGNSWYALGTGTIYQFDLCIKAYAVNIDEDVAGMEYFLDSDPGLGNGIQVPVQVGNNITANFNIPFNGVTEGFHSLYVRAKDAQAKWSLCQIMPFYCLLYRPTPDIVRIEYFLDNDPGFGNGTSLSVAQNTNAASLFNIPLAGVAAGFHILYIRALDSYGKWSLTNTIPFYNTTITNTDVAKLEYFIDTDPGFDNGTNVNISPSTNITKNMNIPLTGISDGFHVLYIRVKDNQNKWSLTQTQSFYKVSLQDEKVCKLEYYIDSDPGFGNGVPVDVTPNAANITKLFYVDLACVPAGNHVIYLRAMDTYNKWSMINTKSVAVNQSSVVISYTGSTNLCPGDSVILKAPSGSGITYQWKQNETNINGATDSIYIAKTSGLYRVIMHHTEYNTCNDSSISITITVTPLPEVAGAISGIATVCTGQNSVTYSVPNINDATSYIWTIPLGATGTSTSNSITLNYGMTAASGNITVKGHNSCGDGIPSTLAISVNGHNISGKTCYAGKAHAGNPAPNLPTYNSEIYYIDNVIVLLKDQSMGFEVARDTSNSIGDYQLRCITDGNYFISYNKYTSDTMQWGNQVTAVDLALLQYYIGHICQTDPSRCFSDKHLRAANVDNNASLTSVDVARISAKIGSPYSPAKNFPKGNWVTFDTSVAVAGANLNITLKTICYGDYDASSYKYKDSTTTWDMAKSLPDENIIIRSDESITINDNEYFEVPLRISTKMNELSAVGLELNYPSDKYKLVSASMSNNGKKSDAIKINPTLEEIIAANNDLLVTDDRGIIRVVFATTNHFDVAANDELVRLGFLSLNDPGRGELDFNLSGTGLIANQYGQINEDAYLTMPKIFVQGSDTEAGFEFSGYPNPFSSEATLTYNIPEDGIVKLNVYNAIGELVTELLNETQVSGRHSVVFSTGNLSESLYTFKLEFTGWDNSKCMILKLIH